MGRGNGRSNMDNTEIARFFSETRVTIWQNASLREPQIEGCFAIRAHVQTSSAPAYVQLPVGCGKTGLMGMAPFGIARGRVLIIAPNLTIRENIRRETQYHQSQLLLQQKGRVRAPGWAVPVGAKNRRQYSRLRCSTYRCCKYSAVFRVAE